MVSTVRHESACTCMQAQRGDPVADIPYQYGVTLVYSVVVTFHHDVMK